MLISTISMVGEDFSPELWQCFQTLTATWKPPRSFGCTLNRLRLCCRCAIYASPPLCCMTDLSENQQMSIFIYSHVCMRLCTHALFLEWDWGRNCWPLGARGFLIPIPHTEVKNQWTAESHDLLPEKVSVHTAARCLLHTAVGHGCVCTYPTGLASAWNTHTHKLLITSHTSNFLVLAGLAAVSQLFVWTPVQSLWFVMKLWAKRRAARRGGDTRRFHSHYTVTHLLPAS